MNLTELRKMKVDELRQEGRDENIAGASSMRKEELVKEVASARSKGVVAAGMRAPALARTMQATVRKAARPGVATMSLVTTHRTPRM